MKSPKSDKSKPAPAPEFQYYFPNPSDKLLAALGKTAEDCVPDEFGKDIKWLGLATLPTDVKIHQGFQRTMLFEEYLDEDEEGICGKLVTPADEKTPNIVYVNMETGKVSKASARVG